MIGETIWVFDGNYRKYNKDENGNSFGSPIYREHWRPRVITDETPRSWVIGSIYRGNNGLKIPKKKFGIATRSVCFTQEQVDDVVWVNVHRYRIISKLQVGSLPVDRLRKIAEIIGYKEE